MKENLPLTIETGYFHDGHIQGIAIDRERKHIYCSFTTRFVKLDMEGHLLGSVVGFTGHLGCLAYNPEDGRVYASLEYKNDAIGQGVLRRLNFDGEVQNAFYVAIFDPEKIISDGMNAEVGDVMKTVFLRDVLDDYLYEENAGTAGGVSKKHRYGCSGIDGMTFAPDPEGSGESRLLVAYGVYGDVEREDNDHQVILSFDPKKLKNYEAVLTAKNIHESGPAHADERYFLYTGNTRYGIQNLEYDKATERIYLAVYPGKKPNFPNYPMFAIDATVPPKTAELAGIGEEGKLLTLARLTETDPATGISGCSFPYGDTGIASLGDGRFYFSEDRKTEEGYGSTIRLYQYTGVGVSPFSPVETEG